MTYPQPAFSTEMLASLDWEHAAAGASNGTRAVLERVLATQRGDSLTADDALRLAHSSGNDLLALIAAANELRRAQVGDTVTYVVNRNINFTNICFVGCKFCAFSRGPLASDSYFLPLEEIQRRALEAWDAGASEVCMQGGLPHGLPPFHYRDILRAVKQAVPRIHCHAFSPMEIVYGVELTAMSLRDYLLMLKDAGLDTLPGTAAEILDDEIRTILSRNKLTTAQWVEVITTAHQCGLRSTSTMMYGHREQPRHWVNQLLLLRRIQEETRGFTEFVPLGFVHQNTLLFQQGLSRPGPAMEEHLKVHALARVMLAGAIHNIQVSWVKLDRDIAQMCLLAGANDYGGTLMEENISREAGAQHGQYMHPKDFHERICELGRFPAERNTTYTRVVPMLSPVAPASGAFLGARS